MTRRETIDLLRGLQACDEGLAWLEARGDADPARAWDECTDPRWLAWAAYVLLRDRRPLVRALRALLPEGSPPHPAAVRAMGHLDAWLSGVELMASEVEGLLADLWDDQSPRTWSSTHSCGYLLGLAAGRGTAYPDL